MAMTKCTECAHDISTKADRCPHCGAPNLPAFAQATVAPAPTSTARRKLSAIEWLGIIVITPVVLLALTMPFRSPTSSVAGTPSDGALTQAPPAVAQAPSHRYTFHQGYTYGYAREVSVTDAAAGLATEPLELVIYGGKSGETYSFGQMVNASVSRQMSCREPCENMVVNESAYEGFQQQVIPVVPGSVLAAMVEDARNGMLTPYVRR